MDACIMDICILDTCIMDTCIMDTCITDTFLWIQASWIHHTCIMDTCITDTFIMDTSIMDTSYMHHSCTDICIIDIEVLVLVTLRGSHGLSARRARRTNSRGPKGLQLEVGARRAPRLLVFKYFYMTDVENFRFFHICRVI